jgi:AcrR family transcriptional regulator
MVRTADPAVRGALVETAAEMLAARVPVTARSLTDRVGTSTTALYTHFGGMPGLWRAVRQEGFTRLAARMATVANSDDAVCDLAALGAAYLENALAHPDLYRAMFDAAADLDDPAAADRSFGRLVEAAVRARAAGRFSAEFDPAAVATRFWAAGHGLASLVVTQVLPAEVVAEHAAELAVGVFVAAGDRPEACRASVQEAWSGRSSRTGARSGARG